MKISDSKKQDCLSSAFEARLLELVRLILRYFLTGKFSSLFPCLFSCFVLCYCSKPVVKRVFKRKHYLLLPCDELRSLNYSTKSGRSMKYVFTKDLFDGFDDFVSKHSLN